MNDNQYKMTKFTTQAFNSLEVHFLFIEVYYYKYYEKLAILRS